MQDHENEKAFLLEKIEAIITLEIAQMRKNSPPMLWKMRYSKNGKN